MSNLTDRRVWLSDVAWRALAHPSSIGLTHACKLLLADAAFGRPLCREAFDTIEAIAADVLSDLLDDDGAFE